MALKTKEIKEMVNVLNEKITDLYAIYNGDCVEVSKGIPDETIDLSIFSPPFASLYTYSNSERDMGNNKENDSFYLHFGFLVDELMRMTKKGRIVAVHCMNIPAMKERDGYIGLKDFRGDIIRLFQSKGFIFHSEHCIWKDPLIEATRTKAIGLMHKQLCKDSSMCRAGIPDYLLAFRKPGENPDRVQNTKGLELFYGENEPEHGNLSHERWRRYASPVWMDIRMNNTLQYMSARENEDERHICPLSLDISKRAIQLWSNEKERVFTPFMGIGSEVYSAVELNRYGIGIELKETYFNQALKNIEHLENSNQLKFF